jgi:hypothetical protein
MTVRLLATAKLRIRMSGHNYPKKLKIADPQTGSASSMRWRAVVVPAPPASKSIALSFS